MHFKRIFVCVLAVCFALTNAPIGLAMDSVGGIPGGPGASAGSGANSTPKHWATGYGIAVAACIPAGLILQAAIVNQLEHRELNQTEVTQTMVGCLFPPLIVFRWIAQSHAHAKNK
jgi:hypothetical protein